MLVRYMLSSCVRLSVARRYYTQTAINLGSRKQRHTIAQPAQGLVFWAEDLGEIPTVSPQRGAK